MYKEYIGLGYTIEEATRNAAEGLSAPPDILPSFEVIAKEIPGKSVFYLVRASYLDWESSEIIQFGNLLQEDANHTDNRALEWFKLTENTHGNTLLLSKYCLRCVSFHESKGFISWADSSLKSWLNETFFNTAFSAQEKLKIQSNPFGKVFILCKEDVLKYFNPKQAELKAVLLSSALTNACKEANSADRCAWWLRPAGGIHNTVPIVTGEGEICPEEVCISSRQQAEQGQITVRPAIWIHL